MSLYGSIRMAGNTLQANQIALQVVGQNIANANTPGYIREEVNLLPGPTQRVGGLLLGMGVNVQSVVQKIDHFLEERLRGSVSDKTGAETLEQTYTQLEGLINELGDTDLSSSLNTFFNSISEILNQPESVSVRNLATLQGTTLAQNISRLAQRVTEIRADLNRRVQDVGDQINRLTEEISTLNVRISEVEGGDVSNSDAVGLRDQRQNALEELAKLIDLRVEEQPSGGVTVYSGGDFLVYEGTQRQVKVVMKPDRGMPAAEIQLAETSSPLEVRSGELHGLIQSRDEVLGGFLDKLDDFARTLSFQFNRVFSSGQGLKGYDSLTSEAAVADKTAPLNAAGLTYQPVNGSFQIMVRNRRTGITDTRDIRVDLNGMGQQTSLEDLRKALNDVDGISASLTPEGWLKIQSDSPELDFSFAQDTSGILAALGINTFFTGTSALTLGVNQAIRDDPGKFAASRGKVASDTQNAVELANLVDKPVDSHNGDSLTVIYNRIMNEAAQGSAIARSVAEGANTFEQTLRAQKLSTSGVSLDEEAVKLIAYQRAFQASARYISVVSDLFDVLTKI